MERLINEYEQQVMDIMKSWNSVAWINISSVNEDLNGIDVIYSYKGKKTYGQIKSVHWLNIDKLTQIKYIDKIEKYLTHKDNKNLYFIFYKKNKNKVNKLYLKSIITLKEQIYDLNYR